jgi:hypothetical protein
VAGREMGLGLGPGVGSAAWVASGAAANTSTVAAARSSLMAGFMQCSGV